MESTQREKHWEGSLWVPTCPALTNGIPARTKCLLLWGPETFNVWGRGARGMEIMSFSQFSSF
jgi:hypothetical protein